MTVDSNKKSLRGFLKLFPTSTSVLPNQLTDEIENKKIPRQMFIMS